MTRCGWGGSARGRAQTEEEKRLEAARKELGDLKDRMMKQQNELATQLATERALSAEISGAKAQDRRACPAVPCPASRARMRRRGARAA